MINILRIAKNCLAQFALIALILEQLIFVSASTAQASDLPITPDGSTNTQIDRAANNVPIVNIAAPNSSGLSHNRFTDYNVNQNGLILNNAIGSQNGVVQTQIGGLINDNANLVNSGAASIILNEVTSNNISQINGYTEVAGKKADVILANPNGIQMNGAGFINVSKFSAVVGFANQINPNVSDLSFSLSGNAYELTHGFLPRLTIMGSGLDLESVTSTDLVANVMNIVAPVYAGENEVNLRAGDQTFNYLTKAVTSDNTNPGSNLPNEVAIDASVLGKIQAGKIFIIATKEGFGIKYSGDLLASRSGITIDNQGNIEYNNLASSAGDISVTSRNGSITQNGISQTKKVGDNITLNSRSDIINYGQFASSGNVSLTSTLGNFSNQSNADNFSNNDFIIDVVDFTNWGQIIANRNLDITANTSTNHGELIAGTDLTLRAQHFTNEGSFYANHKINITASNTLTNNGDIVSLGIGADDGVIISAKSLNNNNRIAGNKNVTINSDTLNNITANSLILGLNNVNLNITALDNSNGNIQAANGLTLRNLKINAPSIANSFGVTSTATSITNAAGTFYAGALLDFDLGDGDYTIVGDLQSAGSTKIKANNIVNQARLQANGYIQIDAADTFKNGELNADNSNNKIIAGTNLQITAANLLSNYGTLSSRNNLTLKSTNNNINNNVSAEIIGGIGTLTLSAKNGTVNQHSLHSLVSNGNLTLDVTDFDNTGRVDIAGNFILNVANNLTNQAGAMIYSGGNMELNVVNNLTNNDGAVIHSDGTLTIQKYSSNNSNYVAGSNNTNQIDNIAATIEATGDITVNANILNNLGVNYDPDGNGFFGYNLNELVNTGGWGNGSYSLMNEDQVVATLRTRQSYITSGGNLTINNAALTNYSSSITAAGDITINNGSLNNETSSIAVDELRRKYGNYYTTKKCSFPRGCVNTDHYDVIWSTYSANVLSEDVANIKAGGNFTLNGVNQVNNGYQNDFSDATLVTSASKKTQIGQNGTIDLDLSSYLNGPDNNGLFTRNPNPNGPLFETRSQFIDQSLFFGSDYFYTRIGLNITNLNTQLAQQDQRMIGDQFFQNKIISQQLSTIAKNSFLLSASGTNVNNQIKSLLDNAADEYARLGLTYNQSLTQNQINSLSRDIIWFETETISGATYIVPKIYLTQASRDNLANGNLATNSTIYAGGNINIASASGVTNAGSITGNNINVLANGNIANRNFSNITAINDLSLTSTSGSISNFSQIKANGAINLSAAQDIINSSTVLTNDENLLNSGVASYVRSGTSNPLIIRSTLLETAGISGGSVAINAGNNFTNLGANITTSQNALTGGGTSSGNIAITAGNDVTISTLQLHNYTETKWGTKKKGGSSILETVTNVGSNIVSAGNLDITSTGLSSTSTGGNINIIGSNLTAAGNGSLTSDFGNVNIVNAIDSKMTEDEAHKKGSFSSRLDSVYDYKETAVESKLNFGGNLAINTDLGMVNLIGSTVSTQGDLNIGSFTVAQDLNGNFLTNPDGTFQTVSGGSVLGVNIQAAQLRSEHSETHKQSKLNISDALKLAYDPVAQTKLANSAAKFAVTGGNLEIKSAPKFQRSASRETTKTITQHSSTLNVGGNLILNSAGDVNISASDINVSGNALLNVDGNLNITSAAEKNDEASKLQTLVIGTAKVSENISHASVSASVSGVGTGFEDSLTTSIHKSSNINIGGSLLANVTNSSAAPTAGNLTIAASNLTVGGDSIIKTAGNFNLTDAQDTSSYSSKASSLTIEVGAKVGNAYVDAVYAWKAVLDAQKQAIKAQQKLKKMEKLREEGKASSKAVALATAQVALAQVAVATAIIAAAAATAGAATAASSSFGTGMYVAAFVNMISTGVKNTESSSISHASNFLTYGDVNIASGNDLNVLGSMLASVNGNVTLSAVNDIKIEAGTNTLTQKSKQETVNAGGSVGNNGYQVNVGMSQGESEYTKTFYTNSGIFAEKGSLTLTTGNDVNISGANLLAKNMVLNVGNNLNVSSKQTEEDFSSNGSGFNFGVGVGAGGNGNSVSAGFNMSSADMHRLWVDDITTLKATDSMSITTGIKSGSTGDLNLTGAAILSDNMTLNIKGDVNKKNLEDSYYSESMSIGVSATVNLDSKKNETVTGTGGQPNKYPKGQVSVSGSYSENEAKRTVFATIGGLNSALTSETKTMNNGDFQGGLTVDLRLLSKDGRADIGKQLNYSKDVTAIPLGTLAAAYNQSGADAEGKDKGGVSIFASMRNKYSNLNQMMFNPKLTAKDLTPDAERLIGYAGKALDKTADASGAREFYDRDKDTLAVNRGIGQTDAEYAGALSHGNYHAQVDQQGTTYTQTEENTAHDIGDFTQSRWNTYQGGNSNFQLTLPTPTIADNFYANNVKFGDNVNPLLVNELMENSKITSPYQTGRIHPTLGVAKDHNGTDTVAIGDDKSIHAAGDGVIKEVRYQEKIKLDKAGNPVLDKDGNVIKTGWGNTALIEHYDENGTPTYRTRYSHMATLPQLTIGEKISEGEAFGTMGATGGVKGAHLHYEVQQYNPQTKGWEYKNPEGINVGKYEKLSEVPKQ